LQLAYYSPFCPKFRSHCNEGQSGKNSIGSIQWPIHKTPFRRKKSRRYLLHKASYSQFCPIFRCHGNGVGRGKMQLAAFDGASPKTPYRRKNLLRKASYSPFCPKCRCHGNQGGSGVKLNDTIRFAIPDNHTLEPKITTLSYTQPKL